MASTTSYMQGARNFRIDNLSIHNSHGHTKTASEYLQDHIAPGGIHNSDERCDAPTCYPETRVAVQQDIFSWIMHGDKDADPMQLMWLSGPAGSGKTAIAGSVAEMCHERDILAGSFFFSSFSPSPERSSKRYLVPTLVYQMLQHDGLEGMEQHVLKALQRDPAIFKKRLKDQFDALILKPFRKFKAQQTPTLDDLPRVFIIDGVDEVKAEKNVDPSEFTAPRLDEDDHLEIISCLLHATKEPGFPFRVFVISRPERVFTDFFSAEAQNRTKRLFLDEKYNPDADIKLYLTSKFAILRRRYGLSPSPPWPAEEDVKKLVEKATGHFAYAATVIRFVSDGTNPPPTQLERVLAMKGLDRPGVGRNPLSALHTFYAHILLSNPNPRLAAKWISVICSIPSGPKLPAWRLRILLETEQGQAEHLLRPLASLVYIPEPNEDREVPYRIYHKSFQDFLEDYEYCPEAIFVDDFTYGKYSEWQLFLYNAYLDLLINKGPRVRRSQEETEEFCRDIIINHLADWGGSAAIAVGWPETNSSERDCPDWHWWASTFLGIQTNTYGYQKSALANTVFRLHERCDRKGQCELWCRVGVAKILRACWDYGWSAPSQEWLRRFDEREPTMNGITISIDPMQRIGAAFNPPVAGTHSEGDRL